MVSPAQRRTWGRWVQDGFQVSERAACAAAGIARSSIRYRSVAAPQEPLRRRLRALAQTRVAYGYRRLHVLLRREGWAINHKRVQRLYRAEGLTQYRKRPRRRKSVLTRSLRPVPQSGGERWAMDFIHDQMADGSVIRVLSVIDGFTRECVALVPARRFRGEDVARVLSAAGADGQLPAVIQADNGTEFTSRAMDHWAYWNHVRLDFSRPGRPTDNAAVESFHNSFRRECLTQHYFLSLTEAEHLIEAYRLEYNNERPHSSLDHLAPAEFAARQATTATVMRTALM
jgi:putative transposase